MGFPSKVIQYLGYAVAGALASANPRASAIAIDGQFVVGAGGAVVGQFAGLDANGAITNVNYVGAPVGFIMRDFSSVLNTIQTESSMTLLAGQVVTPMIGGDFWATAPAGGASIGQKVYAANADGSILLDATGVAHAGYTETKFSVASACAAGELFVMTSHGN